MSNRREFAKTFVAGSAATLLLPRSLSGQSLITRALSPERFERCTLGHVEVHINNSGARRLFEIEAHSLKSFLILLDR